MILTEQVSFLWHSKLHYITPQYFATILLPHEIYSTLMTLVQGMNIVYLVDLRSCDVIL